MAAARVLATAVMMATVLTSGVAAWAGAPTEQLRGRIDRVLQVLEDPQLKSEARTPERRQAVRTIVEEIFDFRELSQRALARHWQARTPTERDEFVQLFADLLERSYIGKIEMFSGGDRIQYTGEMLDGEQVAVVRTRIVTKNGTEIPVDYRLHHVADRWLVYDVAIEGVSLVANYRAQFNKIIQRSSFQQLMAQLAAKRDEGQDADGSLTKRASQK
jgi:phospholipid transport system substrate-binding protein